jgi:hypothetical protein
MRCAIECAALLFVERNHVAHFFLIVMPVVAVRCDGVLSNHADPNGDTCQTCSFASQGSGSSDAWQAGLAQ